jgi:hypothetical protein
MRARGWGVGGRLGMVWSNSGAWAKGIRGGGWRWLKGGKVERKKRKLGKPKSILKRAIAPSE